MTPSFPPRRPSYLVDQGLVLAVEQTAQVRDEEKLAERGDGQRQRRQDHHDEQVQDREAERQETPRPEPQRARPERLARDRRVASARQHLLLQDRKSTRLNSSH